MNVSCGKYLFVVLWFCGFSVVDSSSLDARRPTGSFMNVNMQMTSRRLQLGDMHQVTETVKGECKYGMLAYGSGSQKPP